MHWHVLIDDNEDFSKEVLSGLALQFICGLAFNSKAHP
jgi:hypothetical protein